AVSKSDSFPQGMAYEARLLRGPAFSSPPTYRVSYLTLGDTLGLWDAKVQDISDKDFKDLFHNDEKAGWLASGSPYSPCHTDPTVDVQAQDVFSSWYRRLRLDGSVSPRYCIYGSVPSGHGYCVPNIFFDATSYCVGAPR
ncbi:MAG: hypothetical protein ABUL49_00955, partial [bacterium]